MSRGSIRLGKVLESRFYAVAFVLIALRIFVAPLVWHPDVTNHVDWGTRFFLYTPSEFYSPDSNVWSYTWPNQPPGGMYLWAASKILYDFTFKIFWFLNTSFSFFPSFIFPFLEHNLFFGIVKLPSIIFDLCLSLLLIKITGKKIPALIFLLLPPVWYNSAFWGQTDSIVNFLAVLSFYLFVKDKLFLGLLAFALGLYLKLSLAIFMPAFLVLLLANFRFRRIVIYSLITLIILNILTIPFSGKLYSLDFLHKIYLEKVLVEQMQVVSANAFNLWGLIFGKLQESHFKTFFGISYQVIGAFMFLLSYLPVLALFVKIKNKNSYIWHFLTATSLCAFLLLTNMHERYLYPMFFPLSCIAFSFDKKYLKYLAVFSVINFVNLYNLWWVPQLPAIRLYMENNQDIIVRSFSLISVILGILLYRNLIMDMVLAKFDKNKVK